MKTYVDINVNKSISQYIFLRSLIGSEEPRTTHFAFNDSRSSNHRGS